MHEHAFSVDLWDVFQKGMIEILPADQLGLLGFPNSNSFQNPTELLELILRQAEEQYGVLSANGLFFRCGSAAFKYLVRKHGTQAQIDSLDFRLQPQQKRLMDGTRKLIGLLTAWQAGELSVQTANDLVEITASVKGIGKSDTGSRIWLYFIAGLFQEYLYWAGGGKQYPFQIITQNQPAREIIIQFQAVPVD